MFCYFIGLRNIDLLFYLFPWLALACATGLNLQFGVRGGLPNQRSRRVTGFNAPHPPRATAARSAQAPVPVAAPSRLSWSDL